MTPVRFDQDTLIDILEEERLHGPKMYWNEGDPPPPWKPPPVKRNSEKYRGAMIDFVEWHLNRLPDPDSTPNPPEVSERQAEWIENLGPEKEYARRGDVEPLREKRPDLAEFLHAPVRKRKQGMRVTGGYSVSERARWAADAVPDVKALWKKHYKKKVRRFEPKVEEIVAEIWGVDVKDVKRVLSRDKLKRHKKRRETVPHRAI